MRAIAIFEGALAQTTILFAQDRLRKDAVQDAQQSLKAPPAAQAFQSVVIDASDNGAEAELKLPLRDDSRRQVAVQEERAAPPQDACRPGVVFQGPSQ